MSSSGSLATGEYTKGINWLMKVNRQGSLRYLIHRTRNFNLSFGFDFVCRESGNFETCNAFFLFLPYNGHDKQESIDFDNFHAIIPPPLLEVPPLLFCRIDMLNFTGFAVTHTTSMAIFSHVLYLIYSYSKDGRREQRVCDWVYMPV